MAKEKNLGGRPRIFTTELMAELRDKFANYIEENEIPILAEFCYKNDIPKSHIYELEGFTNLIKKCLAKKEAALEKKALGNEVNVTMAVFSLKQLGWSDRQEQKIDMNLNKVEKFLDKVSEFEGDKD